MKYFILFLIVLGFISADVEARTRTSSPPLTIQEEDGSPTGTPRTLKVGNGDLTNNGDGSFSLATGGGGGGNWSNTGNNSTTGNLSIDGNLSVNNILEVARFIEIDYGGTQAWHIENCDNGCLNFLAQDSGAQSHLNVFSADGDNTDNTGIKVYGLGQLASDTNTERGVFHWNASNSEYALHTAASGSGSAQPLSLYTNGNRPQIYLDTDGDVGINTTSPTIELDVVGGMQIDGSTFYVDDTTNRVGILTTSPSVDGLTINGDLSASTDVTIGRDLYIGSGATTRKSNNKVGIAVAATNPTANTFYSVEIPTELIAGTNFIVEDIIFNQDATQSSTITVTAAHRTDPSDTLTTIEQLPNITTSDYRVEDDGTLTSATVTGDEDIGFWMGLDTTAKVSVIFVGHYE